MFGYNKLASCIFFTISFEVTWCWLHSYPLSYATSNSKGVTMRAISVILLAESLYIQMDERKKNFEEKKIFRQNFFGASTFSAFSKGPKSTSKFWKTLESKKMRNKTFKFSKLLLFFKKMQVNMVKNVKNCSKSLIMWKLHICSSFLRFSPC